MISHVERPGGITPSLFSDVSATQMGNRLVIETLTAARPMSGPADNQARGNKRTLAEAAVNLSVLFLSPHKRFLALVTSAARCPLACIGLCNLPGLLQKGLLI